MHQDRTGGSLGPFAKMSSAGLIAALSLAALAACARRPADTPTPECIQNEQGTDCLPVAPASARVDLEPPSFSNPTLVDNPLHPSGAVQSSIYLGSVDGLPFRSEVTLLPTTKTIEWDGRSVEVLESQYFATLDGRIQEVAIDWYAQADDGSVWYFGEDVFNYEDGALADTHGTWLAGRDGPAAMIMPAQPTVGDVYRPENIPGLVFEEVTVKETDVTVDGPIGSIPGAIIVEELHMDGSYEDKAFAPGYGEFSTGNDVDVEAMALAVPTDAQPGPVPAELSGLTARAADVFDLLSAGDTRSAQSAVDETAAAWRAYRAGGVPPRLEQQMAAALGRLQVSVASGGDEARQAALDVERAALDFELRYRPPTEIDLARFRLLLNQITLDAAAGDSALVAGDAISLKWVLDRFEHSLADPVAQQVTALLDQLTAFVEGGDLEAATDAASQLMEVLASSSTPG